MSSFLTPFSRPALDTYSKGPRVHSCHRKLGTFYLEGKKVLLLSVLEKWGKKLQNSTCNIIVFNLHTLKIRGI